MADYQYRKNDGKWCRFESMDDLADVIYGLDLRDIIEIKQTCDHEKTFVECGIKTCLQCGNQLGVISFRD